MNKFTPMLSADCEELSGLQGPLLASPKLDGIRAIVKDGVLVSRNLKPIRNRHTQSLFGRSEYEGLDGELIVGAHSGAGVFDRTTSGVMSFDGEPDVSFHVFDKWNQPGGYIARYKSLEWFSNPAWRIVRLEQTPITSLEELDAYEKNAVAKGFEGTMLRHVGGSNANAPYKFGRSTWREQLLVKLVRRHTLNATVAGFVEQMHNANELQTDARGYAKRSKVKENLQPMGVLGAFVCQPGAGEKATAPFEVGGGFTAAQRADYWAARERLIGQTIVIEYREITKDGVPRFPVFKGIRHADDVAPRARRLEHF